MVLTYSCAVNGRHAQTDRGRQDEGDPFYFRRTANLC
jgi:hypothetical protein